MTLERFHKQAAFAYSNSLRHLTACVHWFREGGIDGHMFPGKLAHKEIHLKLHKALDELVDDWMTHTGGLPSKSTVLDLMKWSCEQTSNPTPTREVIG